jgi:DNA-binding NarL/FixJ family response regulator
MAHPVRRILIADEHVAIREGVRRLLTGHSPNWQIVAEAAGGYEALRLIEQWEPDVAILPYCLPLLNGIELTRMLKRTMPRTEVLIYSMYAREELVAEALHAGAIGYALKSDSNAQFIEAVQAVSAHKPWLSSGFSESLREQAHSGHFQNGSSTLTQREREVLQLVAEGQTSCQIATTLAISKKTIETHRMAAMRKLQFHNTAELVRYAVRNKIIQA